MDSPENGYWITESTTYKIFADSEEEAREIWNRYWLHGQDMSANMKIKGGDVEADWNWEMED